MLEYNRECWFVLAAFPWGDSRGLLANIVALAQDYMTCAKQALLCLVGIALNFNTVPNGQLSTLVSLDTRWHHPVATPGAASLIISPVLFVVPPFNEQMPVYTGHMNRKPVWAHPPDPTGKTRNVSYMQMCVTHPVLPPVVFNTEANSLNNSLMWRKKRALQEENLEPDFF